MPAKGSKKGPDGKYYMPQAKRIRVEISPTPITAPMHVLEGPRDGPTLRESIVQLGTRIDRFTKVFVDLMERIEAQTSISGVANQRTYDQAIHMIDTLSERVDSLGVGIMNDRIDWLSESLHAVHQGMDGLHKRVNALENELK